MGEPRPTIIVVEDELERTDAAMGMQQPRVNRTPFIIAGVVGIVLIILVRSVFNGGGSGSANPSAIRHCGVLTMKMVCSVLPLPSTSPASLLQCAVWWPG